MAASSSEVRRPSLGTVAESPATNDTGHDAELEDLEAASSSHRSLPVNTSTTGLISASAEPTTAASAPAPFHFAPNEGANLSNGASLSDEPGAIVRSPSNETRSTVGTTSDFDTAAEGFAFPSLVGFPSVSSSSSASPAPMARTVIVERRRRYQWPNAQLNFWVIIMLAASCITLGIYASFIRAQNQLKLPIPWLFVFQICASGLAILFLFLMIYLISQRLLLPGIVILGSFILFVLWLTGTIEAALQLFGPTGSVNGDCSLFVNGNVFSGISVFTLAYLEQHTICESWDAAFAFQIVGTVFLAWMMLMSWQVNRDEFE